MKSKETAAQEQGIKRQDILVLLDVTDSNINGDPDAENAPRMDIETQQGLITDVCLKRKIRDYIGMTLGDDQLYIKHRGVLIDEHMEAFEKTNQTPGNSSNEIARKYMCENRWDVRAFGALMTTGKVTQETAEDEAEGDGKAKKKSNGNTRFDCGAVRGPVQVSFARSIDPITPTRHVIARVGITKDSDAAGVTVNAQGKKKANSGTLGGKYTIPYGLYRFAISVNPFLAKDTGYSEADNEILLKAIVGMLENDQSAARTNMVVRKVYVFTHDKELGSAPRHRLLESVDVKKKEGVTYPRQFSDYEINVAEAPQGVKLEELVDGLEAPAKLKAKAAGSRA